MKSNKPPFPLPLSSNQPLSVPHSAEHIKIFNPRDGQELPLTSVPLETVALTSTLDGGCGCECMGCKWYGPCFIRELRDDRGEKTGDRMMGLCTLM